ncbi:MAG TPA: hypothetical protein VJS20_05845 [Gemmatimonadales bacterium]|nr:hypothetical protein [Gemmatimonadales bacterium]
MRRPRFVPPAFAIAILAVLPSCSKSSAGPTDPVVGSWKVSVSSMNSGTFTPVSFTLTFATSGTGYAANMPSMTYNSTTFDSASGTIQFNQGGDTTVAIGKIVKMHGDTLVGVSVARGVTDSAACEFAEFFGIFNTARDSIRGSINIINLGQGGGTGVCDDYAGFIAVKQ